MEKYSQTQDYEDGWEDMWKDPIHADKIHLDSVKGELIHVDLWKDPELLHGVGEIERKRSHSIIKAHKEQRPENHLLLVNFQIPGTPPLSLIGYWSIAPMQTQLIEKFFSMHDAKEAEEANVWRNDTFHLTPYIANGPWLISTTVPNIPAPTGSVLSQQYYQGKDYFEIDIDIGSSTLAYYIVGLCRGYSTTLQVELFLTLEQEEDGDSGEMNSHRDNTIGGIQLNFMDLEYAIDAPKLEVPEQSVPM